MLLETGGTKKSNTELIHIAGTIFFEFIEKYKITEHSKYRKWIIHSVQ